MYQSQQKLATSILMVCHELAVFLFRGPCLSKTFSPFRRVPPIVRNGRHYDLETCVFKVEKRKVLSPLFTHHKEGQHTHTHIHDIHTYWVNQNRLLTTIEQAKTNNKFINTTTPKPKLDVVMKAFSKSGCCTNRNSSICSRAQQPNHTPYFSYSIKVWMENNKLYARW